MTEREAACVPKVDPTDYQIIAKQMELFCLEGRTMMMRMGISTMIQSGDICMGIYTAQGDLATCVTGTHVHLINGHLGIKYIIKYFLNDPSVGVHEGDMYFFNDTNYGGVHNPDQVMVMPVFRDGELVAWVASMGHETETGSIEPGGMPPSGKSKWDDGMNIPPIKIGENYKLKQDLVEMLENEVRTPQMQTLDLMARQAVCAMLERRVHKVIDKHGVDVLIGALRLMIEESKEAAKKKVSKLVDGEFNEVVFFDRVGAGKEGLLRGSISVRKKGDRIVLDFSGTSPRVIGGNFNALPHVLIANACTYILQFLFWELKPNCGLFEPFEFIFPQGSFIDGDPEDCLSHGMTTTIMMVCGIHAAIEKMLFSSEYGRDLVASWPMSGTPVFAGINQHGQVFSAYDQGIVNGCGLGGRRRADGLDTCGFNFTPFGEYPDTEDLELNYPILCLFRDKFFTDGQGFGTYNGGKTVEIAYMIHNVDSVFTLSMGATSSRFPMSKGLYGGYLSPPEPAVRLRNNNMAQLMREHPEKVPCGIEEMTQSKDLKGNWQLDNFNISIEQSKRGDIIYCHSHAGPGYGDPLKRDPEAVVLDMQAGTISEWAVNTIFKVAFDPQTRKLDAERTEQLRREERENRKQRGVPAGQFLEQWSRKKPPESSLKYFGPWPYPTTEPNKIVM